MEKIEKDRFVRDLLRKMALRSWIFSQHVFSGHVQYSELWNVLRACKRFDFPVCQFLAVAEHACVSLVCVWSSPLCSAYILSNVACLSMSLGCAGQRGSILAGYPCFVSSRWWAGVIWCPADLNSYCFATTCHVWLSWSLVSDCKLQKRLCFCMTQWGFPLWQRKDV